MGLDLSTNCVTVAEVLQSAGYHTGMSGKWHLSRTQDKDEEKYRKGY